jgi:uncharacterized protein (DUF934 family)
MNDNETLEFAMTTDIPLTSAQMPLGEWLEANRPVDVTVQVRSDEPLEEHYKALACASRIVMEFPGFMDGRGFSHGRKIRQLGFTGELLAAGDILKDQLEFLLRCGFTGLAQDIAGSTPDFPGFTVRYQAR